MKHRVFIQALTIEKGHIHMKTQKPLRQRLRKLCLITALLCFPITLYYFSPALIINAGLQGIINGSFIVFLLQFLLSIPFGRLFCAYLCPAGGLQECAFAVNDKKPRQGWKNYIKYGIWIVWIAAVGFCYYCSYRNGNGSLQTDFFFETEHGISVSGIPSYIIYYGIVLLIFVPAILFGKRVFCHYFCWMAPFMVLGTKLRRLLHLPGLHITVKEKNACISCGKCDRECPMGIEVSAKVAEGQICSAECIQCGACIDGCPKKVLSYDMIEGKKKENGDRKEA